MIGEQIDFTSRFTNQTEADLIWEIADDAHFNVSTQGIRNSTLTTLAPTGTIGMAMGCDTTGIEPVLGLIQYKLLAGEGDGIIRITCESVREGLESLGYEEEQIERALEHIEVFGNLEDQGQYGPSPIMSQHWEVFDTSFENGPNGKRALHYTDHIDMMAACQKFMSMGISKTVNMPEESTVEDIIDAYIYGWEKGLKAIAIYRNNSKRSQPLSTKEGDNTRDAELGGDGESDSPEKDVMVIREPVRVKLPDDRPARTHKFSIAGHEGYLHIGFYPDTGKVGEIFIRMAKEGSTISGLMDAFATSVSVGLQWGVPLEDLVRKFKNTRFEPSGFTTNPEIRQATSVVDYIFKYLEKLTEDKLIQNVTTSTDIHDIKINLPEKTPIH